MNTTIDYEKVALAVARLRDKERYKKALAEEAAKNIRLSTPAPVREKKPAEDSALRKPLKSHGKPCSGFGHPHFIQW